RLARGDRLHGEPQARDGAHGDGDQRAARGHPGARIRQRHADDVARPALSAARARQSRAFLHRTRHLAADARHEDALHGGVSAEMILQREYSVWSAGTFFGLLLALICGLTSAHALDGVRIGKAAATTFAFAPIEIGAAQGVWARHGLEITSTAFAGDARMQQAMVANAIAFSLGSGPGMGFLARGVPAKAVAAIANEPLSMGLSIGKNSPLATASDLKGAKVGVATQGSLTFWLTRELSRQMGWGPT